MPHPNHLGVGWGFAFNSPFMEQDAGVLLNAHHLGVGWGFAFNSPFMEQDAGVLLNAGGKRHILPVSRGTNSYAIPQLFSHPHPRRVGWSIATIDRG